jgi:hypothetical protein
MKDKLRKTGDEVSRKPEELEGRIATFSSDLDRLDQAKAHVEVVAAAAKADAKAAVDADVASRRVASLENRVTVRESELEAPNADLSSTEDKLRAVEAEKRT